MFRVSKIKKIIAVIAVLALIYNTGGYIFIYQQLILLTKKYIHSAIEKKEIDEEIILLSFKKSDINERKVDFKWKHEKEFKYNGGMYDIVERFETEDSIHFYCFYDHKENKLEENFNKHFEKEKKENKQSSSERSFLSQNIDKYIISENFSNHRELRLVFHPFYEWGYSIIDSDVPSPPPKFLLSS